MEPEQTVKPWPTPDRELPRTRQGRRPWWVYLGITLVIVLWLAGVALVAYLVLLIVGLSLMGNNK